MTISFSIFLFPDSYYNSWIEAEDVCTSDTSSDTSSSVVSCKANTKVNETHHQAKRKYQEDSLLKLNDFEVPSIYSNGVSDSWCEDASSTNRFVLKIMFVFNNHVIFRYTDPWFHCIVSFFEKQVVILISILLMWNVTPISSNLISVQLSLKSLNKRKIDEQGKTDSICKILTYFPSNKWISCTVIVVGGFFAEK